jgi:alpha-ketoglutarate-dependent taurine dioxygenase
VYTASEYPKHAEIPLHNENAYQRDWPVSLLFGCTQPATRGGQTTLARTADVTARIGNAIVDTFAERRVAYVRNYVPGLDLPWQTVFQTHDRNAVASYCQTEEIAFEWLAGDALRTRQISQGVATHPRTGERLWFNQAHLFHVSALEETTREALLSLYAADQLPRQAYFGDGEPIPEDVLAHVRAAFSAARVTFDWERGDVLLVDNMQVAHGRASYTGPRTVLVAMSQPYRCSAQ